VPSDPAPDPAAPDPVAPDPVTSVPVASDPVASAPAPVGATPLGARPAAQPPVVEDATARPPADAAAGGPTHSTDRPISVPTAPGAANPAGATAIGGGPTTAGAGVARVLGKASAALGHAVSAAARAVTGAAGAEGGDHGRDAAADGLDGGSATGAPAAAGPAAAGAAPAAQPAVGRATAGSALSQAVVAVVAGGFGTSSRQALGRLLDGLAAGQESHGADVADFGEGLRSVAGLLSREPGLRRALTEPSRAPADRAALAHRLLDGRLAAPVATVVADAAADRWSHPRDLVDGIDVAATAAEVAAADRTSDLDSLEDDVFRFERIVDANPELRSALSDRRAPASARAALVHGLLDDKASVAAVRLVTAAVADLRGRSLETALTEVQALVAALQDRVVAVVRIAAPLTPEQRARLQDELSRTVGHTVQLNVIEDPTVLGGFVAEIGDTVIDASIASRLHEARRRLVG